MNTEEHLLTILSEECVEIAKETAKALRFGLDDKYSKDPKGRTNRERIVDELNDLAGVVRMMSDYSILDKEVIIEAGSCVGTGNDFQVNREEPGILNTGISVVGKGAKIPEGVKICRNCSIACNVTEKDFRSSIVQSGETIRPKPRRSSRKE